MNLHKFWHETTVCVALCLAAASSGVAFASQPVSPVGWRYDVFADGLKEVDNVRIDGNGAFYVTLERSERRDVVLKIAGGRRTIVVDGLSRADGLALSRNDLFVTEEVDDGRIVHVDLVTNRQRTVVRLARPEGIVMLDDGRLLVSEDRADGRIVIVSKDGDVETMRKGLNRPEGMALSLNGDLYVAETGRNRVVIVSKAGIRTVVKGIYQPDQLAVSRDGALWITEDVADRGRLLRFADGKLQVVFEGLSRPQGIAFDDRGNVYVAEQGRGRLLRLFKPMP